MTLPSWHLLLQAILSGIFIGGLYGLIGLGLGLTWGLLRQINLAHFGLVFLAGYLSYQMAASWHLDPFLALLVVPVALGLWTMGRAEGFLLIGLYAAYLIATTLLGRRWG